MTQNDWNTVRKLLRSLLDAKPGTMAHAKAWTNADHFYRMSRALEESDTMTDVEYAVIDLDDERSLVSYHATYTSAKTRAQEDYREHPCRPAIVPAKRDARGIAREDRSRILWVIGTEE